MNYTENWCLICVIKIESKKTIKYLDNVKKRPPKNVEDLLCFKYWVKKDIWIRSIYKELLQGEYVFSGRDNNSHESCRVGLKGLIEEMFNEKTLRIYTF